MNNKNPFLILVLDDEEWNLEFINDILIPFGYQTILFSSPILALKNLKEGLKPDIIIADIRMPDMSGFEFYEEVQKINSLNYTPFIFITSLNDDENVLYGKELGVDDYIKKPFKAEDLLSSIKGKLKKSNKINQSVSLDIERLKEQILNTLSPELRTPITSVIDFANLLADRNIPLASEDIKVFSEMIKKGGNKLENLIDDFFDSLSLEIGDTIKSYESFRKEFNIAALINEILLLFKYDLEEKNLTIEKYMPDEPCIVLGCIPQIKNIIKRILSNAIKFSPENGKIFLKIYNDNMHAYIEIRDRGPGIPDNEIPNIFNKFYQVKNDRLKQQGSGLGLYIARKNADINKCQIICNSTMGKGTIFTVQIPLSVSK
jgi:signal transduction histidine kinase